MTELEIVKHLGLLESQCNPPVTATQCKVVKYHMQKGNYFGIARPIARGKGVWLPLISPDGSHFDCIDGSGYRIPASYDRLSRGQLENMGF